ncbi:glycine cleavage system protein GcvH [Alcaligenes endophyticus]|uniref:Glycine cleavage system H protein n=1 Tax=Alcaligenes endophyticus TaxID=1929088 RepID=A0ABT8EGN5_9BURK|nr:glycine cleavage system protein GcvH [Alcaligenes endophyticus]MCX5589898.1 glycine cleavage system protein GcvH [Alcaligenes endophyticus]MDN4120439.1 glycine cleavage system protein GcvH [Alcaligenes endophyticus]
MQLPDDRKYLATHEWVKKEGDLLVVGITDFAQDQLGDLVFVGEFTVGSQLAAGDTAGVVESVKAASDIYAPVAGQLVEFNTKLEDGPDMLNEVPYETWIFKLKPDNAADFEHLLSGQDYAAQLD